MRTISIACLALAASVSAAAPSFGQVPRGPQMPSAPSTSTYGATFNANNGFRDNRDFERNRADMTRQREEAAAVDPERAALADRIAVLVQDGKCTEARAAANEAGDRQMALRVRQTCRAR